MSSGPQFVHQIQAELAAGRAAIEELQLLQRVLVHLIDALPGKMVVIPAKAFDHTLPAAIVNVTRDIATGEVTLSVHPRSLVLTS